MSPFLKKYEYTHAALYYDINIVTVSCSYIAVIAVHSRDFDSQIKCHIFCIRI